MKIVRYKVTDDDRFEPPMVQVYYENGKMKMMELEDFMSVKPDHLEINWELRDLIRQMDEINDICE